MGILFDLISIILVFVFLWKVDRICRENKQLKQENERLQKELTDQINENLRIQDNFNTDPVK